MLCRARIDAPGALHHIIVRGIEARVIVRFPLKIIGEIFRTHIDGIGVKFKIKSQVQELVLKNLVDMIQI